MDPEDDQDHEAALAEARAVAERQTRAAEQANRKVQELKQELLELEEHIAGLDEELGKSQSQASRSSNENQLLKEQVAHLEWELQLRDRAAKVDESEEGGRGKKLGRCKTDGIRDSDSAKEARLHAEMALETAKREFEEVLKEKESELEKQRYRMAALQEQHMQLQQYCGDLRSASQEIQGFLERAEAENVQLQREVEELNEALEVHQLGQAWTQRKSAAQVDFVVGASLADEMQDLEQDAEPMEEEIQKTKSVQLEVGEDLDLVDDPPPPRRKPKLRRSSSSVAASKLAALQEEYEEKFENQSQQLQSALINKERIEREKEEAIDALQQQIEELKGRLPAETGHDTLAGLFQMMSRIKELTAEASDAVLLGFAEKELPRGASRVAGYAEPKAEALKFNSGMTSSAVRSRLQERRQKKAPAADAAK